MIFPAEFVFGVTTAAHQIEGAATEHGRGASVWDVFSAAPGRVADGSTGAVAADHYHRSGEDVALLAELGATAYRFSISWSRVQPGGTGPVNQPGMDFYSRLVDQLMAAGIEPWITLYHSDLPLELMMEGGWLERDTAERFGEYASLIANALGDRAAAWITLDDPFHHMAFGHAMGFEAPGLTMLGAAFSATHHLLLGHAHAVEALHANSSKVPVAIANNHTAVTSTSDDEHDRDAAEFYDAYHNHQFVGPLFGASYPGLLEDLPGTDFGVVRDGDLHRIAAPLDFYGVNYSHPVVISAARDNSAIPFTMVDPESAATTDSGVPVAPEALTATVRRLQDRYPAMPPIVVTGIGAAYDETATDQQRTDYLDTHLAALHGTGARGYFYRSLLDSWEGAEGFTHKYGLVHVDPQTQDRTPRASFEHYRDLIRAAQRAPGR